MAARDQCGYAAGRGALKFEAGHSTVLVSCESSWMGNGGWYLRVSVRVFGTVKTSSVVELAPRRLSIYRSTDGKVQRPPKQLPGGKSTAEAS